MYKFEQLRSRFQIPKDHHVSVVPAIQMFGEEGISGEYNEEKSQSNQYGKAGQSNNRLAFLSRLRRVVKGGEKRGRGFTHAGLRGDRRDVVRRLLINSL